MRRYIDADKLIEFANNMKDKTIDANDIARFPAADVVEVVRCEDCKHFDEDIQGTGLCSLGGQLDWANMNTMYADDFCSYGERADK